MCNEVSLRGRFTWVKGKFTWARASLHSKIEPDIQIIDATGSCRLKIEKFQFLDTRVHSFVQSHSGSFKMHDDAFQS